MKLIVLWKNCDVCTITTRKCVENEPKISQPFNWYKLYVNGQFGFFFLRIGILSKFCVYIHLMNEFICRIIGTLVKYSHPDLGSLYSNTFMRFSCVSSKEHTWTLYLKTSHATYTLKLQHNCHIIHIL